MHLKDDRACMGNPVFGGKGNRIARRGDPNLRARRCPDLELTRPSRRFFSPQTIEEPESTSLQSLIHSTSQRRCNGAMSVRGRFMGAYDGGLVSDETPNGLCRRAAGSSIV
jgi:hypothetical protein